MRNSQGQIPLRWEKSKKFIKIPLLSTHQKTAFIYKVELLTKQESAYVRKDFLQDEGTWVPPLLGCLPDIKSFRIQYLRAKEQNNTSGQERTKFIYFQHLAKFMSTRPIAQSELVVNAGAEYVNVD
jgi:hypothetical protein